MALGASAARAEPPRTLRIASVVPEGTAWAREFRAMARDVDSQTHGALKIKWYLGGIAGDELAVEERVRRDQLDAVLSAGMLCEKLAPSMRVMRLPGLFQSRDESAYVLGRLKATFDKEFLATGFTNLGEAGVGASILFTRTPIRGLTDLKRSRLWVWDIDEVLKAQLPLLGMQTVPLPIADAGRAYDEGKHDGFVAPPTAALGFQWSAQAKYYADLRLSYVSGCLIVANRAFDSLPGASKEALRAAAAKVQGRIEDLGRVMDEELLGGLFQRQGLTAVQVSQSFRADFFDLSRGLRERSANRVVPQALIDRVLALLADFRGEHH
jgi:TRAP-type C4-dicarboxylate transport system substrate-binding protein